MNKLINPELFERLETDIKQLISTCQALTEENQMLYQKYDALQKKHTHLKQKQHDALLHAQAIVEELILQEEYTE